jgi:glycosyltransferase involved in cell wall biosynthesis
MSPTTRRSRPRVLLLCLNPVGGNAGATAIRAYQTAAALSGVADVRLAATRVAGPVPLDVPTGTFKRHDGRSLEPHLRDVDIVVSQPQWPLVMRALRRSGSRLIFDLHDPETLGTLEITAGGRGRMRRWLTTMTVDRINEALRIGHHFICAGETQRDLYIGAMLGAGLITPGAYDRDPSYRSVIDTVPFAVPDARPISRGDPWEAFDGIGSGDEVVLWNGGLWSWFDAATAIYAIGELAKRRPAVRLVFMGSWDRPEAQRAAAAARALSAEVGLLDRVVFFNEGWVPYDRRADWLLAADCALGCHFDHLESRFAVRIRVLDCLWAGLPVVSTGGVPLADEIESEGLGEVVPVADASAVAAAVERVLDRGRESYKDALQAAAERYRSTRVSVPLVRYVTDPNPSPRLGGGWRHNSGHSFRSGAYRVARGALNAAGVEGWPGRPSHEDI